MPRVGNAVIDLNEVGAHPVAAADVQVRFGVYLPDINPVDGYEVVVRIIHALDRFVSEVAPLDFPLQAVVGHPLNLWQTQVAIPLKVGTHLGQPGTYLYRYQLQQTVDDTTTVVTSWFTDPFAQQTDDVGLLSAFVASEATNPFTWTDAAWKVPPLDELVVYELHVEEFNSNFQGVIDRLPHLSGLGVTCLELMPVTSLKLDFDWGYGPLHYFAPNHRWGGAEVLKSLVDACHAAGMALILDVVYQHVDFSFPYHVVYANANRSSPMIGQSGSYGPQIDFSRPFAREYVLAANRYWLHEYHVDGFRYDEVSDFYDGATGVQYAQLAYETYNESLPIARFTPSGGTAAGEYSRIVQVAEALSLPRQILRETYSSATWQDELVYKAEDMIQHGYVDEAFAHLLDPLFSGYPSTKTVHDIDGNAVDMPVAPFQYVDSHDHSCLTSFAGTQTADVLLADRSRFYLLQPFAIALMTCQGIPMLWQGQEFAESYVMPLGGDLRIHVRRDVHWEYFYDDHGSPLIRLYRILGQLRRNNAALRSTTSYYDNVASRPETGIIVFHRLTTSPDQTALVVLNFSDSPQSVLVPFPRAGTYRECIDDDVRTSPYTVAVSEPQQPVALSPPSHYGYVFLTET
jgi:maltooligosyltrehalose trehalohydrolase